MADELLTVAEAAERLGVSIPRLRRWLARPENTSLSFSMQRRTRTGMRTARLVSISALAQIESKIKQKRERKPVKDVAALLQSRLASVEIAAEHSGRLHHHVAVGTAVKAGDVLGSVT